MLESKGLVPVVVVDSEENLLAEFLGQREDGHWCFGGVNGDFLPSFGTWF